jgi:hypothetical protein
LTGVFLFADVNQEHQKSRVLTVKLTVKAGRKHPGSIEGELGIRFKGIGSHYSDAFFFKEGYEISLLFAEFVVKIAVSL